jgi:ABC-2 type transport system permease protein
LRLLFEVARRSFRRWSTYRMATAAGVFTNTVFGYLRAYILIAVAASGGSAATGWDEATLVTFAFITQALLAGTGAFGESELAERVRTGDVVVDMYRPIDLQAWWLASWLGRSAYTFLARGIPPVLLGAVVFDLVVPTTVGGWAAFLVSVVLASLIGFALRFCVNLTAFWLLDNRGLDQLVTLVLTFFGGLLLPVVLFPSWLEAVARALPFAAMIQIPAEMFLGRYAGTADVLAALATQLGWFLALGLLGRMMLAAATRKVVIQGG